MISFTFNTCPPRPAQMSKVERNLEQFADCAVAASGKEDNGVFFFVATDEAQTQELATKVWWCAEV